ncbi:DUF7289 family protein [Natronorubrum texcoconense]|uniref:Flagellin N-terminal-like domain-containing protein n=1 Tax=Natronorubrum texcoconense TaxID=1095776 RepID=A0A1G9EZN7_9EURY|nr:archaellin/type IV pilin N-terminal domain-containing protein [Natronorubrum texcoconense]SDK81649.1 flagellin N-terminal-like domain-containing protein [Natronorubrum texcoconense]
MAGAGGNNQGSCSREKRGVSPIVGLVLLIGMVIAATALLFLIGSPMLDTFESESERERAHLCMDETDHQLATVAGTGEQRSMPSTDISECQIDVADEGQIEFVWYNDTEADDIPWDDDNRTASAKLGALEFELEDRTIAHQGGAIWEDTGSETRIISEPGISYENESDEENRSVQFNIMLLDQDELSSSDPVARADHERSDELAENITNAASESDGNNVAIRIESSYHDGWNRHLEDTLEGAEISHDSDAETVEAKVTGVRETSDDPELILEEDKGLTDTVGSSDQRVVFGDQLRFAMQLNNTGGSALTPDATVSILGTPVSETQNLGVGPGIRDRDVRINSNVYQNDLIPGQTYQYQYSFDINDESLDTPGEFYLGKPGTHFNVTGNETTSDGENITISADIWNQGVENATGADAQDISLEFDHPDIDGVKQELELDYGAEGTVEWTINESAWPGGEYPFTIATDNDSAHGILNISGGQEGDGIVVTADHGVLDGPGDTGDQRVDVTEETFTIGTEVTNTNLTTETQDVALSLPGESGSEPEPETVTLESNESETVAFEIDTDDFEAGSVYEYNVSTENSSMTTPGTFYAGYSGTYFEASETNATHDDDYVTVTSNITNLGVESGSQDIGFELEYLDDLPEELEGDSPYGYLGENTVERSFGESDTIELALNESNLIDGEYEATIHTDDGTDSVTFDVDAGIDPGRVGLGEIEDAEVTVEVLGSQVSGDGTMWSGLFPQSVHNLAPMTLDILADENEVHSFENPDGGDNINTGPTWQDKSDDSYRYNFSVDDEIELTLRNTRHNTCQSQSTDPNTLPHYSGPTDRDFMWCTDAPSGEAFGPIDASQGENLQNVRVRSAENNTIPALPAGNDQQLSATEVLEQQGLIADSGDELDLGPGEFVFLFENTETTDEDGIDALWDDAIDTYEQYPDQTYDPNFNDLIVYVEVERAGVNPDTPSITIIPGGGDETNVSHGGSDGVGEVGDVDVDLGEGSSSAGNSPSVGTGESAGSTGDHQSTETGIDIDTDYIVIG